ncbi:MAG: ATP-grasp domain-containing protein [Lachnospiraceae bacterium]|nr:ATP-grasp domain-containing protein [Lachnospiraceae bacterium]
MKIAFYSTGGMSPDSAFTPALTFFPKRAALWDDLADRYKDHTIDVYVVLPATHLIDSRGTKVLARPERVNYHILPQEASIDEIAGIIAADRPDCAVAYSLPDAALDWNPVRDAMVGLRLAKAGIRVLSHGKKTAMNCFKKYDTNRIVRNAGFNTATGVYVQGLLYYSDRRNPEINHNVYKEFLRDQIDLLDFPVVVKPAAGSGSVGISIANDTDEVLRQLDSIDAECDMVVEEKVEGYNFGIEIYGTPGYYAVTEPVMFSMTGDGVTDPFASVKYGPVDHEKYRVDLLKKEMVELAEKMSFCGIAEIDLIFSGNKWYVIEINPRFSLLSAVGCAMREENMFEALMRLATGTVPVIDGDKNLCALDFKSGVLDDDKIEEVVNNCDSIKSVMKFECRVAEGVDVGYCEWVMAGRSREELAAAMAAVGKAYPDIMTDAVRESAGQLGVRS